MTRAIVPERNAGRDDAKTAKPRVNRPIQGDRPPDITLDLKAFKPKLDSLKPGDDMAKCNIDMPRRRIRFPPLRIKLSDEKQDLEAAGVKPSFTREQGLRYARAADVSMGL